MVTKWINTSLLEFANDPYIRFDYDYINISKSLREIGKNKPLKDFITFIETGKPITREDYADGVSDYAHIVVRNVITSYSIHYTKLYEVIRLIYAGMSIIFKSFSKR